MKNEQNGIRSRTINALESKVKNLREGDEFTSFNDLCRYLDIPLVKGNSRKSQLTQFERFFDWTNEGNKMIITNVYEEPLPDITDGIYSGLIKQLILDMLSNKVIHNNEKHLVVSFAELIKEIDVVNNDYSTYKNDNKKLADELGITLDYVVDFYNVTDSKLYSSIVSALNSMKNKALVDYQIVKMLRVINMERPMQQMVRKATTQERETIVHFERLVLEEMNCSSKTEIVVKKKWEEFADGMHRYFRENKMEYIDFYYNAFDIVFNQFVVDEGERIRGFLLSNKKEIKKMLNERVVYAHKESYVKRHEKAMSMLDVVDSDEVEALWGYKRDRLMLRGELDYVDTGNMLIDKTIKK